MRGSKVLELPLLLMLLLLPLGGCTSRLEATLTLWAAFLVVLPNRYANLLVWPWLIMFAAKKLGMLCKFCWVYD